MTLEAQVTEPTDPWRSAGLLSDVYESEQLVEALAEVSGAAACSRWASGASRYVNTLGSVGEPFSRWLRYREAYSPLLVKELLERFPPAPGTSVLDPMCGSGSSLLAAQAVGRTSIGVDVSPYAVLASRVKTRSLPLGDRQAIGRWVDALTPQSLEVGRAVEPTENQQSLEPYFPPANFRVLCAIDRHIRERWPQGPSRDLLEVALLAILEESSDRRKDGNGLASRPSRISDPLGLFVSQIQLMLDDLRDPVDEVPRASCLEGSAVNLVELLSGVPSTPDVGVVVFSPPYPNSFDYFQSYKLELLFSGLVPIGDFQGRRGDQIRSFRQSGVSSEVEELTLVELLIDEVLSALPRKEALTGIRDARTRLVPNLLRGYFSDMQEVLSSCGRILSPKGRLHIVVDQSAYAGIPVPTDLLLAELGLRNGFEFEELTICRRSRTSGQQLRLNPALGSLLREAIVTLRRL
ncbi:MAG: hypothetical protein QM729_19595 [Solirubrobacterales bacterium]